MKMPAPTATVEHGQGVFMSKSIEGSSPSVNTAKTKADRDGRHPNDITVLKSYNDWRQTKLIRADGSSESADNDTHFHHHYERVATLTTLEAVLHQLALAQKCFVIRGRAKNATGEAHRRKWSNPDDPLEDMPRKWLMVDIDKPVCDVPDDWQDNPSGLVREIIGKALPDEFHVAGVVWQWSSSMGVQPGAVKVHLWFRLDKAIDSKMAKKWLKPWNMYHDASVLQAGQPHYTATPLFEGMNDPVRERVGLLDGPDVVVPNIEEINAHPDFNGKNRVVGRGYEYYRDLIGNRDFHMAMLAAVGSFISRNWPDPDIEWLRSDLRQYVLTCDAPNRTQVEREHRAGDHLDKLIEWTMQRQRESAAQQARDMEKFQKIMQAEIEDETERLPGSELQRKFFDGLL
jgi:hypothetical protein